MLLNGKGAYALLLALPRSRTLRIGRLGTFCFPAGYYIYLGSALGPGGLAARLTRHRQREKKQHWHIDYLRPTAGLEQIWALNTDERSECRWAAAAQTLPTASVPAPRFGASDCRCPAHLFQFSTRPDAQSFAAAADLDDDDLLVVELNERGPGAATAAQR